MFRFGCDTPSAFFLGSLKCWFTPAALRASAFEFQLAAPVTCCQAAPASGLLSVSTQLSGLSSGIIHCSFFL